MPTVDTDDGGRTEKPKNESSGVLAPSPRKPLHASHDHVLQKVGSMSMPWQSLKSRGVSRLHAMS